MASSSYEGVVAKEVSLEGESDQRQKGGGQEQLSSLFEGGDIVCR